MKVAIEQERLSKLSISELRLEYEKVHGEPNGSRHKGYLIKRILWRMQANQFGGLSEAMLMKAKKLADPTALRLTAPKLKEAPSNSTTRSYAFSSISNGLAPGTQLERIYKGARIVVTVAENGFRWNGELYRSLSAVAKAVTGTHWNGRLFFGVNK